MPIKFLANHPAAVVGSSLVIADLHLGIEFELNKNGLRLSPNPSKVARGLAKLAKEHDCNRLIVLGDFKHEVSGFGETEKRVVRTFLDELALPVTVVKGNHDGILEKIDFVEFGGAKGIAIEPASGMTLKDGRLSYGLAHGHAWPSADLFKCNCLLLGNLHPVFDFRDELGAFRRQKVWLMGKIEVNKENTELAVEHGLKDGQKFVVFPAYSELAGGGAVNELPAKARIRRRTSKGKPAEYQREPLGPLFTNGFIDKFKATATLLDGTTIRRPE